jgi:hypothetical protein
MIEVFAGFLEHTDHHIGRLIDFRLESPRRGSQGLIYDLPATARPARIQGVAGFGGRSGANVISQAEKFAKLDFICG